MQDVTHVFWLFVDANPNRPGPIPGEVAKALEHVELQPFQRLLRAWCDAEKREPEALERLITRERWRIRLAKEALQGCGRLDSSHESALVRALDAQDGVWGSFYIVSAKLHWFLTILFDISRGLRRVHKEAENLHDSLDQATDEDFKQYVARAMEQVYQMIPAIRMSDLYCEA